MGKICFKCSNGKFSSKKVAKRNEEKIVGELMVKNIGIFYAEVKNKKMGLKYA